MEPVGTDEQNWLLRDSKPTLPLPPSSLALHSTAYSWPGLGLWALRALSCFWR